MILKFSEFLNEQLAKQGKEDVNVIVGRFQPFHKGHLSIVENMYKENKKRAYIFIVRGTKLNEKTLFSEKLTEDIVLEVANKHKDIIAGVKTIPTVAIDKYILGNLRPKYEPVLFGAGDDRVESYQRQIDSIIQKGELNVKPEFKVFHLKRSGGFVAEISASKVREAIKNDDKSTFEKMMPEETYSFYDELKKELNRHD